MMLLLWLTTSASAAEPEAADLPPPAEDPVLAEAKRLYQNGARHYEEGMYDQAIEAFFAAWELSKNPKLLFNVANAQERNGDLQASYDTLNRYRVYADEGEEETLDRRLRSLERRLDAASSAPTPPPAPAVPPPGQAPAVAPAPAVVRPNPTKWVLLGTGAGAAVAFGASAGLSYASGRARAEEGDEAGYGSARALNNVSVPLAGVGAGLALLSLALPSQRTLGVSGGVGSAVVVGRF